MVKEEVIVKPTVEDVTKELASLVEKVANEAISTRGKFIIGLSGKKAGHWSYPRLSLWLLS